MERPGLVKDGDKDLGDPGKAFRGGVKRRQLGGTRMVEMYAEGLRVTGATVW